MYKRAKWFEKEIARHLIADSAKTGRNNGLIRGSSVGAKCLRKLGYMVLGYGEEPTTAHRQYVLGFGNAFHDMVQTWMAQMGFVNAKPRLDEHGNMQWTGDAEGTILDVEDGIIGHYDGLTIPLPEDMATAFDGSAKRYLLEFKTISNKSRVQAIFYEQINGKDYTVKYTIPPGKGVWDVLPRLEGSPPKLLNSRGNEEYYNTVYTKDDKGKLHKNFESGTLLNTVHKPGPFSELVKPKDEHVQQATYYASRLKADAILIVYLAKDLDEMSYEEISIFNLPIKAFEVDVDEKTIKDIREKASSLWSYLETGAERGGDPESWLPPRPFSPDDPFSECKFCPFTYVCYKDHPKVKFTAGKKFEEQALANLPVASGQAFERHGSAEWGRKAAKQGLIRDEHGQEPD